MANRHRICSAPSLSTFEPNLEEPEDDIERCPDCNHDLTDETECNVCEWTAPSDDDKCDDCGSAIKEVSNYWECDRDCGWWELSA